VLVVQHIADGFTAGLAEWLDGLVALSVRVARDGEPAGAGVAIAPDGAHLLLAADGRLQLERQIVCGTHRPSADVLLASLAAVAGRGVVAVILTGMGRDGADGVAAVRLAGGVALAERSEQAHLPGMPAAAAQAGATPLGRAEIGRALASISGGNGR
jgi:two-component system chemotaxis response regulator CheB